MGLPNIKTFSGAAMAAAGAGLAAVDAYRLAHGDVSIFAGSSFAAAFATHAGLLTGGFSLMATGTGAPEHPSPHHAYEDEAQHPALILIRER